jgi:hypothetical protein
VVVRSRRRTIKYVVGSDPTSSLSVVAQCLLTTLSINHRQWQLPFAFDPSAVVARFANGKVTITLPKPDAVCGTQSGTTKSERERARRADPLVMYIQTGAAAGSTKRSFGQFTLAPGSDQLKVDVDVQQAKDKFTLTVSPSKVRILASMHYHRSTLMRCCCMA